MAGLQEWQTHPEFGTPEAETSLSATTGQPEWMQHPEAPPAPEPSQPVPMGLGTGFVPKFLAKQGSDLTFGLADKTEAALEAGIKKLTSGGEASFPDTYHKRLGEIRGEQEQFSQTNPVASGIAAGTGMAGSVAALPSEGIAATAGLIPKLVEGAKIGGVAGGLGGFGGSNDESVKGDLAATGAGTIIGAGLGAGGAAIADRVIAPVMNWVARRFSPEAAQSQAVKAIAKRMGQDTDAGGPTAQDMLDLMNAAPDKPQALVDVAGENTRQYGGRIARQPGEGRAVARQALNDRDVGAGPRIAGDIDTGISAGGSAFDTNEALMQARSAAAQPTYDTAFQQQQIWSPRLQHFLDDPVMHQGLRRGVELERIDSVTHNRPFDPTTLGIDLDQQGNVVFRTTPNMRVLDAGKRGLDAMIADERNPLTGRLSQRGVSLDQFRRAYVGQLDQLDTSGTYAAARASWAGPSASMDAVRAGQAILNKRPEEIASEMAHIQPGNREFYRLGAADALKEKVAKTGMGGDEAKRIIGNQYTQNQLRPLFDQQADFDRFINSVTAENRMFETRQKLIGGSQTAERVAEDAGNTEAAGHAVKAGAFMAAGEPIAGGLSAMKALGALMRGESPEVNSAASRILFTPQSMTNPTTFQNLRQIVEAQQARTRPRLVSIPASAAVGSNPVPILSTLPALGQSLGVGGRE